MSETNKKSEKKAVAYEVVQVENDKLKLIEGRYALSTKELRNIDGMIINTENYEIVRDEKTGKVLRMQDNRTINEIIDDKNRRKILEAMSKIDKEEKTGMEH